MHHPSTHINPHHRRLRLLSAAVVTGLLLVPAALPAIASPTEGLPAPASPQTAAPTTSGTEEPGAGSTLTLSTHTTPQNSTLTIDYTTDRPHEENWIALYAAEAGIPDGDPPSDMWKRAPGESGSLEFELDKLIAGEYTVWFLAEDGYEALTDHQQLTITPATEDDPGTLPEAVETDASTDGVIYRQAFGGSELPEGWSADVGEDTGDRGNSDFRGWKLHADADWESGLDRMRGRFTRSAGTVAVADAARFGQHPYSTTLRSEEIPVAGEGPLRLSFDSHYRSAAGQEARVTVSFDGGEPVELLHLNDTTVEEDFTATQMNAEQSLPVEVPDGAKTAQFSWEFSAPEGGEYWAIDSVAVHRTLNAPTGKSTDAWIVSDIQGHPHDFDAGLRDLHTLRPDAAGLMIVGDLVDTGAQWEWDEIDDVMDATEAIRPETTIASIGNHERYAEGGWEANRERFLTFADRDEVWAEYVLEGPGGDLPVITIGQDAAGPTEVPMSEEQVTFLQERLAYWAQQKKQVIINTHYPLAQTVSASWLRDLQRSHQRNNYLTDLLGAYPNAVLLTGHTHFDGRLADWQVKRRTPNGHPDGFSAVNTIAMHNEWAGRGETTRVAMEVSVGDINQGLTLESYGDRVVIKAYDFFTEEQINEVTIPNPLVEFDAPVPDESDDGEDTDEPTEAPSEEPTDDADRPSDDPEDHPDEDSGRDQDEDGDSDDSTGPDDTKEDSSRDQQADGRLPRTGAALGGALGAGALLVAAGAGLWAAARRRR